MSGQSSDSPVFVITGCSSGFGRELTIAALASGFRVIATAWRVESLTNLEARGAKILPLDVTASVPDIAAFAAQAIAIYGQVDYLVNNAGSVQSGPAEEVSPAGTLQQFNTNFFGLVNTTNAFLPHFGSRRTGTLVNISSESATISTVAAGIYSASKAAVNTISDTWASELAEYGIRSIAVQPGLFRTNVLTAKNMQLAAGTIDGYALVHGTIAFIAANVVGNEPGDPAKAAPKIIELVTRPEISIPLRFVVGDDAVAHLKEFYEKRIAEIEAARDLGTGTSFTA
ncbi:putative short-chain oxidoreductase [Mycena maculata]|uniref:Short-chain oxidoreductase n=1 Tax=Mycena maculata TaxID=230809 RepID=A0AAD7I1C9_9AGAR|nr:putative short-chain oxidoreductase [Mycena maculata]